VAPKHEPARYRFGVRRSGEDSGFAITPYGEWHARELEIMVDLLGFTPGEALRCTTSENAKLLREGVNVGRVGEGAFADILVCGENPLKNIKCLQKKENIRLVYLGGKKVDLSPGSEVRPFQWEHSFRQWNDIYTRDRVAQLAS
jgi:hypothetical protein